MPSNFAALMVMFGEIRYAIPKLGEHGSLSCVFGRHWWTMIYLPTGLVVGVGCPVCRKTLAVHSL